MQKVTAAQTDVNAIAQNITYLIFAAFSACNRWNSFVRLAIISSTALLDVWLGPVLWNVLLIKKTWCHAYFFHKHNKYTTQTQLMEAASCTKVYFCGIFYPLCYSTSDYEENKCYININCGVINFTSDSTSIFHTHFYLMHHIVVQHSVIRKASSKLKKHSDLLCFVSWWQDFFNI